MDARPSPLRATVVRPEQALRITPFGLDMNVLLTTEATGGAISVLLGWHKPGEGPPDHVHFNRDEIFFILEGTYELTVGGRTTTLDQHAGAVARSKPWTRLSAGAEQVA